jgi:serine/threonine-protein kinase HipA
MVARRFRSLRVRNFIASSQAGSVFHGTLADTGPDGWAKRVILRGHAKGRQAARSAGQHPEAVQLQVIDFLLVVNDAISLFRHIDADVI